MRRVLAIPLEEVVEQFARNTRQDVKVVAPEILAGKLIARLTAAGRALKPEQLLDGIEWRHSPGSSPNALCESSEFGDGIVSEASGPFTLCFANEKGKQDAHFHPRHVEVYFSEHPFEAEYRQDAASPIERIRLRKGGVLIFAAGVVHRARLGGITMVIEIPAVKDDKVLAEL